MADRAADSTIGRGARPSFTVVIPTRDRSELVERAAKSVLAQTWTDFELLVVDDGSTDDTAERLAHWSDPRLRVLSQPRRGVSAARNLGAKHARGRILTFLDSDDEALPEWLAWFARGFGPADIGIVCVGTRIIEHRRQKVVRERIRLPAAGNPLFHHQSLLYTAGSLAVKRTLFLDCGGYLDGLQFAENAELAMRLVPLCMERGLRVTAVEEPLVVYHKELTAWSTRPEAYRSIRESIETILSRHGERMRRCSPASYANYRAIAALNASLLGDPGTARHHLARALRARPLRVKNYLRWLLTFAPSVAKRVWARHDRDTQ